MIPGKEAMRGLRCLGCGRLAAPAAIAYTCEACGANQEVEYDLKLIGSSWPRHELADDEDLSIWRYAALLPVESRLEGSPVGFTPLIAAPKVAKALDLPIVLIKDDGRNPSASFKDRASNRSSADAEWGFMVWIS